ncbi:hypothetical protein BDL97_09G057800 [Sphagnum fallax]|nr:hypothetical protein BDL97_09G057800 [Sphagnum fallax]
MQYLISSKDEYKILKRKDSDATEHGIALEDLRASLMSDLRTSEGARQQQQQFCGPTVALTFNLVVSVGIILMNKLVLGKVGFNFPIALSLIHYVVSWVIMAILKSVSLLPAAPLSKATPLSTLVALSIVMAFSTGLANVSLKYNSVGFYQMAKIAVTPTIVLAEFLVLERRVSFNKGLTLVVVSVGVAIASVTDLDFHLFGAIIAVAWIIPSAINKILWSNLQQHDSWTALALMWRTTPITVFALVALMPWLDPPGIISFDWRFANTGAILISAIFGFLLQWSGALALGLCVIPIKSRPEILGWCHNGTDRDGSLHILGSEEKGGKGGSKPCICKTTIAVSK